MSPDNSSRTLAIDFGTSNSAAGTVIDGQRKLVQIEPGQDTLPTSVFFDFSARETLIGRDANLALIEGREGRFMRSLKSVLGTSLMHEKRWIMGREVDFVDIIGDFLAALKLRAESDTGHTFDTALSGRPVHFHSNDTIRDRQALLDLTACYERAGFRAVRFLYEPEAAAIANGSLERETDIGLIVDIGGGTSDFSLFRRAVGRSDADIEIIANHGVRVGGTDFDRSISINHVMPLFGRGSEIGKEMGSGTVTAPNAIFNELVTWQKIQFQYSGENRRDVAQLQRLALQPKLFARLANVLESELGHDVAFAVERGKISANRNTAGVTNIDLGVVEPQLSAGINALDLGASLASHIEKIRLCAVEILEMANVPTEQISKVIFVGGSSLMQAVESSMAGLFPRAELEYSDAFTAIIDGLATASEWSAPR